MKITVVRNEFSDSESLGTILVEYENGTSEYVCESLEDTDRRLEHDPEAKIPGETAIPRGLFELAWTRSPRFQRFMLEVLGVPGYTGVRFHAGNSHLDTEGCILTGQRRDGGRVLRSRLALERLEGIVVPAIQSGEKVMLEVT